MKLPEDTGYSIKINRWIKHIRVDFWYFVNFFVHFSTLGFWRRRVWEDGFGNTPHLSVCFLYIWASDALL